jgi:hypothetical protein
VPVCSCACVRLNNILFIQGVQPQQLVHHTRIAHFVSARPATACQAPEHTPCCRVCTCDSLTHAPRSVCPFVHPGEKARRRDPRIHSYQALPCPYDRKVCWQLRGVQCEGLQLSGVQWEVLHGTGLLSWHSRMYTAVYCWPVCMQSVSSGGEGSTTHKAVWLWGSGGHPVYLWCLPACYLPALQGTNCPFGDACTYTVS